MNTERKIILVVLGIIAVLIFYRYSTTFGIAIQGIEPVVINDNWKGIPVQITAAYIGNLINVETRDICNNNDETLKIYNNYTIGDSILLNSSITRNPDNPDSIGCGDNYIYTEFNYDGLIEIDYNLNAYNNYPSAGDSYAKLNIYKNSNLINHIDSIASQNTNIATDPNNAKISDSIILNVSGLTKIELLTFKSNKGSANAGIYITKINNLINNTTNFTQNYSNNLTNNTNIPNESNQSNDLKICCMSTNVSGNIIINNYLWKDSCSANEQIIFMDKNNLDINTKLKCESQSNTQIIEDAFLKNIKIYCNSTKGNWNETSGECKCPDNYIFNFEKKGCIKIIEPTLFQKYWWVLIILILILIIIYMGVRR